jgi:hypothetical protein
VKFCIVGTGRCGTTLVRTMLDRHPAVFVHDETHWVPKMWEKIGAGRAPGRELLGVVLRTQHVTGGPVAPEAPSLAGEAVWDRELTVREFCDAFGALLAGRRGKRDWADKTPDYGGYMALLQSLWPESRFLHVVRDGVETVRSMSQHPGYHWLASAGETWWCPVAHNGYYRVVPVTEQPLERFVEVWRRRFERIREEAARLAPGSYLEVRFEQLVQEPRAVLTNVARFLELDASAQWLLDAASEVVRERPGATDRKRILAAFGKPDRALLASLGYEI